MKIWAQHRSKRRNLHKVKTWNITKSFLQNNVFFFQFGRQTLVCFSAWLFQIEEWKAWPGKDEGTIHFWHTVFRNCKEWKMTSSGGLVWRPSTPERKNRLCTCKRSAMHSLHDDTALGTLQTFVFGNSVAKWQHNVRKRSVSYTITVNDDEVKKKNGRTNRGPTTMSWEAGSDKRKTTCKYMKLAGTYHRCAWKVGNVKSVTCRV